MREFNLQTDQLISAFIKRRNSVFLCVIVIFVCFDAYPISIRNPFRVSCVVQPPPADTTSFLKKMHALLSPSIKKPGLSWYNELIKFNMCAESKNLKILKIKKLYDDGAVLKSQGKLQDAQKLLDQADALLKLKEVLPFPGTSPDSPIFIKNVEQWWSDQGTIVDLKLARCATDAEAIVCIDAVYKPLSDWGANQINEMLNLADMGAQYGLDVTGMLDNVFSLWDLLYMNGNSGFDTDHKILSKISDSACRTYLKLIGNFSKQSNCPPTTKDFIKFGTIVDKAIINIFPFGDEKSWGDQLENEMKTFMDPYLRSVAQKTPASATGKWNELKSYSENLGLSDLQNEIKSKKVSPPECYVWAGTIKYTIYWNGVHTSSSNGSGFNCDHVTSSWNIKDTMNLQEIITLPGTKENVPVVIIKCRQIGYNSLHSESSGCHCRCGKDGLDECSYSFISDLPNWIIESNVTTPPLVSYDLNFDPINKIVKVSFENKTTQYTQISKNGKEQYSSIKSQCPGLPGKPMDLTKTTKEEGYALLDTCTLTYDPVHADRIVGKIHLDQPRNNAFGQGLYDAWKKGAGSEGATFDYRLRKYSYDFEVDLKKVLGR